MYCSFTMFVIFKKVSIQVHFNYEFMEDRCVSIQINGRFDLNNVFLDTRVDAYPDGQ